MNVLLIGGAGYIGSHMGWLLRQAARVTVLDDLSQGWREAVLGGELVEGSFADVELLAGLLARRKFDAVMHFASHIQVGESVRDPAKYYRNNLANTLTLLETMCRHDVKRFVFSSTAAVYGDPEYLPIDEAHPKRPINPYGRSKRMAEQVLEDFDKAYGLKSVCLRYFNAAGAHHGALIGERHEPETHLVPLVLQAASGRLPKITVYGRDYDTPDGTCIRDYVHVLDLAQAHRLALQHLMGGGGSAAYNLGNGQGFSVQQVIDVARKVTGRQIAVEEGMRRLGDPPRLIADSRRAVAELRWQPRYADLATIVTHAWRWEQKLASQRGLLPGIE
jgi:UDP-glucose 4-epimerase